MIDIQFNIRVTGEAQDDPLLDDTEVKLLLTTMRVQMERHIRSRLDGFEFPDEPQPPVVLVSGTYSLETEQMDVNYAIEAEHNQTIMQIAGLLSR